MPIADRGPTSRTAVSRPSRTSFHRWSMSQNRRSPSRVGSGMAPVVKRRVWVRSMRPSAMVPTMTRPEEAPRSTAPMWTGRVAVMRDPFGGRHQVRMGAGPVRVEPLGGRRGAGCARGRRGVRGVRGAAWCLPRGSGTGIRAAAGTWHSMSLMRLWPSRSRSALVGSGLPRSVSVGIGRPRSVSAGPGRPPVQSAGTGQSRSWPAPVGPGRPRPGPGPSRRQPARLAPAPAASGLRRPNQRRCRRRARCESSPGSRSPGTPASDRGPAPGPRAARRAAGGRRC